MITQVGATDGRLCAEKKRQVSEKRKNRAELHKNFSCKAYVLPWMALHKKLQFKKEINTFYNKVLLNWLTLKSEVRIRISIPLLSHKHKLKT